MTEPTQAKLIDVEQTVEIEWIDIEDIQPFVATEDKGIEKTFESMGQLVPILVTRASASYPHYKILGGRRRVQSAKNIGQTKILAHIVSGNVRDQAAVVLIENLQRSSNAAQEAQAIGKLLDDGMTQQDIANAYGISKAKVSWLARLLNLTPTLFTMMKSGDISARAAWVAAEFPVEKQEELAEQDHVTIKDVLAIRKTAKIDTANLDSLDVPETLDTSVVGSIAAANIRTFIDSGVPISSNQMRTLRAALNILEPPQKAKEEEADEDMH